MSLVYRCIAWFTDETWFADGASFTDAGFEQSEEGLLQRVSRLAINYFFSLATSMSRTKAEC